MNCGCEHGMRRYTPSYLDGFMEEDLAGSWMYVDDHLAFVAQVREVAEGMGHDSRCQVITYRTPFSAITRESDEAAGLTKCTCPRGRLLAMCEVK